VAITPVRTSIDSDNKSLDPVYEEEEGADLSVLPLKSDSVNPTAMSTPARYGRNAVRSRSASPHKRSDSLQPGATEKDGTVRLMPKQSLSPPLLIGGVGMPLDVDEDGVVREVVPGKKGVPGLPQGANGSFETLIGKSATKKDDQFEWPEDVF
jgi:hypothetical protein